MSELIISVSGLRGIVGENLTPPVVAQYLAAYCNTLAQDGPIVLSFDGRTSGPMLRDIAAGVIVACGRTCLDAHIAATPTLGVLVQTLGAAGGVQISASHNPPAYNGIKLFSPAGRVLDGESGAAVRQQYQSQQARWCGVGSLQQCERIDDPHLAHLERVLATVDVKAIKKRKFRVVLDSNHGSGSVLGKRLLAELGCELIAMGDQADGRFAHPPEPIAENLQDVGHEIIANQAALGFCQDPDADRLALIDASGRYVGEEYTVALCVKRIIAAQNTPGSIVINLATSSMSQKIAMDAGWGAYRSAVGEANVADMMLKHNAIYGGEGNGGPIDPRVGLVRDSFVGMAQVLDLMASTGKPLAELVSELPRFEIYKDKAVLEREALENAFDAIEEQFDAPQTSRVDGLRLSWPDRWLLVRGSNTEPIVRFIAEARTLPEAERMCHQAREILNS